MAARPGCRCDKPGCKPCVQRRYRDRMKVRGGPTRSPGCANHFDWEAVERAWNNEPVGRPLTRAERLYLCELYVRDPGWEPQPLARFLGLGVGQGGRRAAEAMAAEVIANPSIVPSPDWLGRITA